VLLLEEEKEVKDLALHLPGTGILYSKFVLGHIISTLNLYLEINKAV